VAVRISALYSMLYDADTRVRNLAQETLSAMSSDDVTVFITETGHARVLDFLAHNLPKGSPALEVIARAPTLAKRTRNYLASIDVMPSSEEAIEKPSAPPGADSERSEDSLEWSAGDPELPDGVEFKMPTEDREPRDETELALQDMKKPPTKESPPDEPSSSAEAESSTDSEIKEQLIRTEPPGEESVESPAAAPPASEASDGEGLFPVFESAQKAARERASQPVGTVYRKKEDIRPKAFRSVRGDFLRGIVVGLVLGVGLVATYIFIDRFIPDWPKSLSNFKSKLTGEARQPEEVTIPVPGTPIELRLGTYTSTRAWKRAQRKAESLGLATRTDREKNTYTLFAVDVPAGKKEEITARLRDAGFQPGEVP